MGHYPDGIEAAFLVKLRQSIDQLSLLLVTMHKCAVGVCVRQDRLLAELDQPFPRVVVVKSSAPSS